MDVFGPRNKHQYQHYFVKSFEECIALCLRNYSFDCWSIVYYDDWDNRTCLLNNVTRKMEPPGSAAFDPNVRFAGFIGG